MKYVWFNDFHRDGGDKVVVVSEDEFSKLLPYQFGLRMGNECSIVQPNGKWIQNEEMSTWLDEVIYARPDADLRPSEFDAISFQDLIEVALC